MRLSTETLARSASRHPWRTLAVWVVALLTAVMVSSLFLGDALTTETDFTNDPESKRAAAVLADRLGAGDDATEFVVVTGRLPVGDPEYRAFVEDLQATVAALGPDVVRHVGSYLTEEGPVSESGRATLLPVFDGRSGPHRRR